MSWLSGSGPGRALVAEIASGRLALWLRRCALPSLSDLGAGPGLEPAFVLARAAAAAPPRAAAPLPSLADALAEALWLAVPKRKVTPSRKGNRSATKGVRLVGVVSRCSQCDRLFPPHAMPSRCEEPGCGAFNLRARPGSPAAAAFAAEAAAKAAAVESPLD